MSITNALSGLGSPVAYYPRLAKFTGSVNAAILLSQFMYWRGRGYDGEVYKTQAEIEEETGLGKEEQRTAIRKLKELGVLVVEKKGMPAKNHFVFDWSEVDRKWAEWDKTNPQKPLRQSSGKPTSSRRESPPPVVGNPDDLSSGKSTTSRRESRRALKEEEITTETTQEITAERESTRATNSDSNGSRLASDWTLPAEWEQWAITNLEWPAAKAQSEAAIFKDHWLSKSGKDARKADWFATWRNWCRRTSEFARTPNRPIAQDLGIAGLI
jgi:hypothetical protein